MKTSGNRALFGILFLIFIFFIILIIFATYTMNILKDESSATLGLGKEHSIAVVEIGGPILEAKKFVELLIKAEEDRETKAIIVRINSPGGAVGPSQEIYEEIRRIDDQYNETDGKKGKPVYASFGSVAASGGYYIGAAARKIYSNPGTLTGSIGVLFRFMDLSKLYKWAKIRPDLIKAGEFKDAGGDHRALSAPERKLYEKTLEGVRRQFIAHILRTRKKRIKDNIEEIAQGQVFSGEQALRLGLVDELAGLWTAGRRIHEELGLKGKFGFKFIRKKKKKGLWKFLDHIDEAGSGLNYIKGLFSQGIFSVME